MMVLQRSFKRYIFNVWPVYKSSQSFGASILTTNFYERYVMVGHILTCLLHCEPNVHTNPLRTYQVVVAATRNMGIGKEGKLPWKLPSDLKFFKELTITTSNPARKNAVIMGRKTWESIPLQYRPLPGRLNVVLTRSGVVDMESPKNLVVCRCLPSALKLLAKSPYSLSVEKVFIIGGGQILRESLNTPQCDSIHITEIETDIECDTFIPTIDFSAFKPWYLSSPIVENNIKYSFVTYVRVRSSSTESYAMSGGVISNYNSKPNKFERKNFGFLPKMIFQRHDECQYLRLVEEIISFGTQKADRTEIKILSKFGCQMRFNLRKSFPLLTTKTVSWCEVVEELLRLISDSTDAKEKDIHLWDGNAFGDNLDRQTGDLGPIYKCRLRHSASGQTGDLGPIYKCRLRHSASGYKNMHADNTSQRYDQLSDVIYKIKTTPDDKWIILSAWNPSDLKLMALPPSEILAQFYVANGELSCQLHQCSADMDSGAPFNIASYALLTYTIAHVCGLVPGDFIHVIGDAHVSKTRFGPLQEQLQKHLKPFPILKINPQKKDINSFVTADFELIGYHPNS